ncbi:insulinase family protein [Altererythrobacter sp. CC-YST694]|uniref:M16 family metallopeptidase n=1 Tax=Altererythrobacter sp. CC-YST694 TaxID=2755038 RepID=UPI001D0282D8|nr:insulinase family protein [Altererythrobacter sp. CC-YST694]MCB5424068.1 insulinase family protein [Altererythrobacter sp. CC-YST694]
MTIHFRAARLLSPVLALLVVVAPAAQARDQAPVLSIPAAKTLAAPASLKPKDPWLYRGSDIPHDEGWLFGELPNGLRYAVRNNRVPGEQVSIRIRIDAGSLNEEESERGYAHLIEHLTFRESKYLANGQAIPTWQRLGARLGADTNAVTSPTQTVYQLDLPNAVDAKLDESIKLLSGMIREPALSTDNITAELPIVLAEKRENGGPGKRLADASSELFYKGQLLATRSPVGLDATLQAATSAKLKRFHQRWYRPENTVIVIAGDGDPHRFGALIEQYFSDWKGVGKHLPAPDFGKPQAPKGAPDVAGLASKLGETKVMVEPDLPRGISVAVLRPWGKPIDNIEYNRGLMIDRVAQQIINRRLVERARAGGSYVLADVNQREVSRSANATFIDITPLGDDWKAALKDVRAVIADALESPPSEEEIARELSEIDVNFADYYEQRINQPGPRLADDLVGAVDIRETVASPETFLSVLRGMRDRFTPQAVLEHTRKLFQGPVTRAFLLTPKAGEATEDDLRKALLEPVDADNGSRVTGKAPSFADMPAIGTPAQPVARHQIGVREIEQLDYANNVHALVWRTDNEPGRVTVRVRFGSGYRAFAPEEAPYIKLGQAALVASGVGPLGATELDAIAAGRKLGFDFGIEDGTFSFEAQTRREDLADQLWLFAAKLSQPRWDERAVERAKALSQLGYDSLNTDPASVISRDLDWVLNNHDPRFATPTPAEINATTAAGFRKVWEPLLKQGPVEILVFGDIDPAETEAALARTFGALPQREPIPAAALARKVVFSPVQAEPVVLYHHGEADQAAAGVAWPLGGGVNGLRVSRELEVLSQIFNNRLLDALREKAGASYTPYVSSSWPTDIDSGGQFVALAQLKPEMVPEFFAVADNIAADLAKNGPDQDEIVRVTEPILQLLNRSLTAHVTWMNLVEGSTGQPERLAALRTLFDDYTVTTPERIKALAAQYIPQGKGLRVAVIPKGTELARHAPGKGGGAGQHAAAGSSSR